MQLFLHQITKTKITLAKICIKRSVEYEAEIVKLKTNKGYIRCQDG